MRTLRARGLRRVPLQEGQVIWSTQGPSSCLSELVADFASVEKTGPRPTNRKV